MGIEVTKADADDLDRWDSYVERSPHGTIFHQRAALEVLAAHSGARLHHLIGHKGQEPIGLFPVFEITKGPITTVFSPPPKLGVPSLGPALLNHRKLSERKRHRLNKRFAEGSIEWIDRELGPQYIYALTGTEYRDPRPFQWNGFDVAPKYTYHVDLTVGEEAFTDGVSSSLRRNVRNIDEDTYRIFEGGPDAIEFIIEQVKARFEAQDKPFDLTADYAVDLYEALPEGQIRPYVAEIDDEWVSGVVVPTYDGTSCYWQGGGKPDVDVPINDVLHWRVITDEMDRGGTTYDLVGANTPRLCRYKAKFAPELREYYEMERGTPVMNVVSDLYKRFR